MSEQTTAIAGTATGPNLDEIRTLADVERLLERVNATCELQDFRWFAGQLIHLGIAVRGVPTGALEELAGGRYASNDEVPHGVARTLLGVWEELAGKRTCLGEALQKASSVRDKIEWFQGFELKSISPKIQSSSPAGGLPDE